MIAEETLGLERGTIKATVLIETIPAAFCMDAILYELRDHAAGLNAGRWDYIFSVIKRFRSRPEFVLPDRSEVTMTVPFMKAYSDLVVKTCHARGAHAMGGMAAVIPSRTDEEANERAFEAVSADKEREANDGFDGTWVAHPDSVPVAMEAFDAVLGERPNQVDRQRDDVEPSASALLDVASTPGDRTEEGLRSNVNVGIQYISSWLRGNGAAAIYGLMEDAATAEIARGQVWQWIRHGATLDDGRTVTPELVRELEGSELERIRSEIGDDEWFEREGRPDLSRALFERVALSERVRRIPDSAGIRRTAAPGALKTARRRWAIYAAPMPLGRRLQLRSGGRAAATARLVALARALCLAQLAQRALALVAGGAVQDQHAVEVVHLVLDHAGLEAGRLDHAGLAVLV